MYNDLKDILLKNKQSLYGSWVDVNKGYDNDICNILGFTPDTKRYWDSIWNNYYIEFKKGKSIWLDLVRYSEIVLKINEEAKVPTVTLFFIPDKNRYRIEEIICVVTDKIILKFNISEAIAHSIVNLNEHVPRSLNAQANLTIVDIEELSDFII